MGQETSLTVLKNADPAKRTLELKYLTTTMNMAMALPPEVLAQMKKQGMAMPGAQTMTSQMCMTQAEVARALGVSRLTILRRCRALGIDPRAARAAYVHTLFLRSQGKRWQRAAKELRVARSKCNARAPIRTP